jgi:two-component system, NtrC family, nitrogen regulation response regulator NtrX
VAYILLVDDDHETRELLEMVLTDEGYEVGSAARGSHALVMLQERRADLILLDLWLTSESGESLIEAYRALPYASARIVLLSAVADLEQVATRLAADGYIPKPFDLDDLLLVIENVLSRS